MRIRISQAVLVSAAVFLGPAVFAQNTPAPASTPPAKPAVPPSVGPGAATPPPARVNVPPVNPTEPELLTNVFDADTKLSDWLEGAKARAASGRKRILIVWGSNSDELGPRLKQVMSFPSNQRILDMEYEQFWAEIATGAQAEANRALAATVKAKIKPGEMAYLTVLDEKGSLVGGQTSKKMIDPQKSANRPTYGLLFVQDFLNEHLTDRLVLPDAINDAAKAAGDKGRNVFVWFREYEERWSDRFGRLLARPDVKNAIEAHLDILEIDLTRTDAGWDYVEKIIPRPQSLPLFMTVGVDGRPIAVSQPPGKDNIGFPTDASEVAQMVAMIRGASPKMTDAQAGELSKSLLAGSSEK